MKNDNLAVNVGSCILCLGAFETLTAFLCIPNSIGFGIGATALGCLVLASEFIRGGHYVR